MAVVQSIQEISDHIRPVRLIAVGNQLQVPAPLIYLKICGLLAIDMVEEVVSVDPPLARYVSFTSEQLHGRGTAPALTLLKLLASRSERFALKDWLTEAFCHDRELFSDVRLDNIVSQLRSLLCPPAYSELRTHLVKHLRGSPGSGNGYQLAAYPLIWVDADALAWLVEQAVRMERFGDDPLPYWESAYALARRGPYLPDEIYNTWSVTKREEVAGLLRQSVQALAQLYLMRHGTSGEEEALLLLRSYWLDHLFEEDVLRSLMELLGQRERYHEALTYYERLQKLLEQENHQPDAQTRDLATYLQLRQLHRSNTPLTFASSQNNKKGEQYSIETDEILLEEISSPNPLHFPESVEAQNTDGLQQPFLEGKESLLSSEPVYGIRLAFAEQQKVPGTQFPQFWNVPHMRNPFFTGREELLAHIHESFQAEKTTVAVTQHALCGLGGIGKTQLALEYAYRYCYEYNAVFWIKADTRDNLLADFLSLSNILQFPESAGHDQSVIIAAIKQWMRVNSAWLFILDNADDLSLVREFLPAGHQGHILLTTRAQALGGLAHHIDVEEMNQETGITFLLRRAGLSVSDTSIVEATNVHYQSANALIQELGGLPLALDQAGAYIEETRSDLEGYLTLYRQQRQMLLNRRGGQVADHPEPVSTTWSLAFIQVELLNPLAASFLYLCAFLDPDAIPNEFLLEYMLQQSSLLSATPVQFLLNDALSILLRFSLIRRNAKMGTITIHRLVQTVIQDGMDRSTQKTWSERAIIILHKLFPQNITMSCWPQCQRLLAQVHFCFGLIEGYALELPEAGALLNQAGYYLREQALYQEAELYYQQALALFEKLFVPTHPEIAQVCYNLARLYFDIGQYDRCEQFHLRALTIREQMEPPDDLALARSLNSLAFTYYSWGKNEREAKHLFQQALPLYERAIGSDHPITSHCLSNLALLYATQGAYSEAEQLLVRVREIRETHLDPIHLDTARSLQNLAWLYIVQRKHNCYDEAKQLLERSLDIRQHLLGPEHPQVAISLHNLATLYEVQERFTEAEQLYQRVLIIRRSTMGMDSPKVLLAEKHYANLLRRMARSEEADLLDLHVQEVQKAEASPQKPPL